MMTALKQNKIIIPRNRKFAPLWTDTNRFNFVYGGAGSGKSVAIGQKYADKFTGEIGHNVLVVRKVGRTNRYSTFSLMKNRFRALGVIDALNIRDSDMTITNPNGDSMIFEGLDDPEKIKSITFETGPLTDIWLEEGSEATVDDFRLLNLRLRGQAIQPFQFTISMNPINIGHWAKQEFIDRPKKNATVLHSTYLDNRFIDDDYKAELEDLKHTDPIKYQVYALGEWGELGEIVFSNVVFEPCRYGLYDFDRVVHGMDFGFNHYHANESIGIKDGELYSFKEVYERQKTNQQLADIAKTTYKSWNSKPLLHADSAEPKSIAEWRTEGFKVEPVVKKGNSVVEGFRFLRGRRWHIDEHECPGLAAEVRSAVYRKDKNGTVTEEVVAFHDDALAACRYAIEHLLEPVENGEMGTLNVF